MYLAKEFDHASKALGIVSELHKWSRPNGLPAFGDMYTMYPNAFEPVGPLTWPEWQAVVGDGSGDTDGWSYHEFVEANGSIYDPSAGVKVSGSWGNYEDSCFEKYSSYTAVTPSSYTWTNNQPGQSSGCEGTGIHVDDDAWPPPPEGGFIGPPHGY